MLPTTPSGHRGGSPRRWREVALLPASSVEPRGHLRGQDRVARAGGNLAEKVNRLEPRPPCGRYDAEVRSLQVGVPGRSVQGRGGPEEGFRRAESPA